MMRCARGSMTIPTCDTPEPFVSKKTRSPSRSASRGTGLPLFHWSRETRAGIDCSGLTRNAYRAIAVALPRVSRLQWKSGTSVPRQALREGDLVFFDTNGSGVSHVGMVIDPRAHRIIHASSSHGVVEADMDQRWFQSRYLGARRVTN